MVDIETLKTLISRKSEIESQAKIYGGSNLRFISCFDGCLGIVYRDDPRTASSYENTIENYLYEVLNLDGDSLYLYDETSQLLTSSQKVRASQCPYDNLEALINLFVEDILPEAEIEVDEVDLQNIKQLQQQVVADTPVLVR